MQNDTAFQARIFNMFCHFVAGLNLNFQHSTAVARLFSRDQVSRLLALGFEPGNVKLYEPDRVQYNKLFLTRPGTNLVLGTVDGLLNDSKKPSLAYLSAEGEWAVHFTKSLSSLLAGFPNQQGLTLGLDYPVGPGGETIIWQGVRSLAVSMALFPEQAEKTFFQVKSLVAQVRVSSQVRLALREMYFVRNLLHQILLTAGAEKHVQYMHAEDKFWKEVMDSAGGPPLTFRRLKKAVENSKSGSRLTHLLNIAHTDIALANAAFAFWSGTHSRLHQARFLHFQNGAGVALTDWFGGLLESWVDFSTQVLLPKSLKPLKLSKRVSSERSTLWTLDYELYK